MRHPLAPSLLLVLALLGSAILGATAAGAAADPTISGQVTDGNGTPVSGAYVLVEPAAGNTLVDAVDGGQVVPETLLKLALSDPDGITVLRTNDDGVYSGSLPGGSVRVVAVGPDAERVSGLHEVESSGDGATVDLEVDRHRVLGLDAETAGPVAPGNTTTVGVRIANPGDDAVRSLSVTVGDLPAGWTLDGVDTDGRYDADAGRITWDRVEPNGTAEARLHVGVPDGAELGHNRVGLTATSDSHFVEQFDAVTIVVRPADATPTPTVVGGDGTSNTTPRVTGTLSVTPTESPRPDRSLPVPGFGVAAALGGVAVALVLAVRRP